MQIDVPRCLLPTRCRSPRIRVCFFSRAIPNSRRAGIPETGTAARRTAEESVELSPEETVKPERQPPHPHGPRVGPGKRLGERTLITLVPNRLHEMLRPIVKREQHAGRADERQPEQADSNEQYPEIEVVHLAQVKRTWQAEIAGDFRQQRGGEEHHHEREFGGDHGFHLQLCRRPSWYRSSACPS